MGQSLYWMPVNPMGGKPLPVKLKWVFEKEYGHGRRELDIRDLEFLRGLKAAEIEGAETLIDAIEKHGEIEIYWE